MTARDVLTGVIASLAFGTSGAFIKPLLESGWSPTAAVAMRTGIAGIVLAPLAIRVLGGRWSALWKARWRILGMALVGVAGTQLAYFVAIQRMPVGPAILIEYLAPVLLVVFAWASTRRMPRPVILIGSLAAIAGLILVIGPGSLTSLDPVGVLFAALAAVGAASYYLIAARPADGLPPVALAASGLLLGSLVCVLLGGVGALSLTATFGAVDVLGMTVAWWVPMGVVGVIGTAVAYAASITATAALGSRLMSFVGLLEVVFAAMFAWLLLGEQLGVVQLVGGALILAGISLVHANETAVPRANVGEPPAAIPAPAASTLAD